jgi:putative toxin-antitoxin system antitoxin component (TIGR02293 family)
MQAGGGDSVLIAPDPGAETLTQPPQAAEDAEALLGAARAMEADTSLLPARRLLDETIFAATFALLGGADVVGRAVRDERDLLSAISLGFPAEVLTALRQAGFRGEELEAVIGPRRTLARRKADGQRLTAVESDAAWRLAHLFALAAHVLKDADVALAWLRRSKTALGDQQPARVANTSVGTRAAERLLMQLEWGDVA